MSDQDTEMQNSQTADEREVEETHEEQATEEDLETKNKQLYARLKKAEEELKGYKTTEREESADTVAQSGVSNEQVERLQLQVDGYSKEEIDSIMGMGGVKALSNPLVKKGIEVARTERETEAAQVDADSATSAFTRKYSPEDLRKMSAKEIEEVMNGSK